MNQKKLDRKARFARECHRFEDRDYFTGRSFSGEWIPMPSEEPRDRFNAPLAGAPALLVNQFDKVLSDR